MDAVDCSGRGIGGEGFFVTLFGRMMGMTSGE